MGKTIIVSNRLPIQISKVENNYKYTSSSGGLATGMNSIRKKEDFLWIGWPGISLDEIDKKSWRSVQKYLDENNYYPVNLQKKEIDEFYYGLSNKALWPLFHYFIEYSVFNINQWESYVEVNKKFSDAVIKNVEDGDIVWVHDYQLLLCPKMIRDIKPNVTIGFFLHIPFPSFEIFRIFPWREELLQGILGADQIGFHTYDYERHFLSSVKRILKYDVKFNRVEMGTREVVVDTFSMGIDYQKFNSAAKKRLVEKKSKKSELKKQLDYHKKTSSGGKLILSIDRLDYTKGVVNRIKAFEIFLRKYPQYLEKVRLVMLTVPSRAAVSDYKKLKRETDEIVGRVNGEFATVNWTPIWYYYRNMDFEDLVDLYTTSDIAMITPVRDGMNLVAKEFISTRVEKDGILILSEMAGASKELFQAILVNPFDLNNMAEALYQAVNMSKVEQVERNRKMRKRLKRYNVEHWAKEFMKGLNLQSKNKIKSSATIIDSTMLNKIKSNFMSSSRKLVMLDYDGTLIDFNDKPKLAIPSQRLNILIDNICKQKNTDVYIISGRDQKFLSKHFDNFNINLIAEHGYFKKHANENWLEPNFIENQDWMADILPIFEAFTDRTPGTFIEKKKTSLVWHYRKTDPELASERVVEFKTVLNSLASDELQILDIVKGIEVSRGTINKGKSVIDILSDTKYDFILCAGDDITDETMFESLSKETFSIKIGRKKTKANYFVDSPDELISVLERLIKI
jgi:trehalose 6-phosphate synthase/phosphatase